MPRLDLPDIFAGVLRGFGNFLDLVFLLWKYLNTGEKCQPICVLMVEKKRREVVEKQVLSFPQERFL
jgi:hypothetical protein